MLTHDALFNAVRGERAQDMRQEQEVSRCQAGVPVMQACFLPSSTLLLAAAGGDGAIHLHDLGRTDGAC